MNKQPLNIIILPNWVGDFVMAFASIHKAISLNPDHKFMLMGKNNFFDLIAGKYSHKIWISADRKDFISSFIYSKAIKELNPHHIILMPNSFRTAFIAWLSQTPNITGTDKDKRGLFLTKKVKLSKYIHQSMVYLEILKASELKIPPKPEYRLFLKKEDLAWAEDFLNKKNIKKPIFIIHPSASKPQRSWSADRFRKIAKKASKLGFHVICVGSQKESDVADYILSGVSKNSKLNIARENLPLGKLAAIISKAYVFLGNDSGPIHIAASLNVKNIIGIYGPSSPKKTSPLCTKGTKFVPVTLNFECSPCRERFFKECTPLDNKPPCLYNITTDMVEDAILKLI